MLHQDGNAVDAAVAAIAAQGVVAPETCGMGGDLFALVHASGWEQPEGLNSSGRAGSRVSADGLRDAGHTSIPLDNPVVATIPGCVDGMAALIERHGNLSLSTVLQPAIELAEDGFEVSNEQARAFAAQRDVYAANPAVAPFYPDGGPVRPGDRVRRSALARTLTDISHHGRAAFYEGAAGEDIIEAVGGLITAEDLSASQAEWIAPIAASVGGLEAWTIPPNSQGYLGPATLAVFEMLDPPDDPDDPAWWHLLIEAYRCLSWERSDLVADPEHLALPADLLLDVDRLSRAAASVDARRAGVWPQMGHAAGTAYLCVADSAGMAVSLIQSNYRGTGSPFGARRSGFLLQDRGAGFSLTPGHPNELAPGKRPLHTLSPTLWTDGTEPRWILGTRGGAVQPQLVAQVAARSILGKAELDEAQSAPRWTVTDFGPNSAPALKVEPDVPDHVVAGLTSKGHAIQQMEVRQPGWGPVSVIELDGDRRRAAADPRVDTTSAIVF